MDKLFKNEELIQRFGEGFKDVKKYRAFAKKNREMFIWIDHNIFRIETIQEILKEWGVSKAKYFKYYGKKTFCCIMNLLNLMGNDLFKNWKRKYQIHR